MKKLAVALIALHTAACAGAEELKTEEQKTFYALGLAVGRNLSQLKLKPGELDLVKRGLTDAATGATPKVELQAYAPKIQEMAKARMDAAAAASAAAAPAVAEKGKPALEAAAKEKGAVKTASGLVYVPLKEGTGAKPAATDTVKVNYEGKLTDGKVFDASARHGGPAEFPLNGVIPCWTEGVQMMKVGGKAKLVCPASLAYGDRGTPDGSIPGGSTLIFEVELVDVKK